MLLCFLLAVMYPKRFGYGSSHACLIDFLKKGLIAADFSGFLFKSHQYNLTNFSKESHWLCALFPSTSSMGALCLELEKICSDYRWWRRESGSLRCHMKYELKAKAPKG